MYVALPPVKTTQFRPTLSPFEVARSLFRSIFIVVVLAIVILATRVPDFVPILGISAEKNGCLSRRERNDEEADLATTAAP